MCIRDRTRRASKLSLVPAALLAPTPFGSLFSSTLAPSVEESKSSRCPCPKLGSQSSLASDFVCPAGLAESVPEFTAELLEPDTALSAAFLLQ